MLLPQVARRLLRLPRLDGRACDGYISTYDAKAATVEQAQNYASCIHTLYPKYSNEPMTRGEAWAIKGAAIFVLVCIALGIWWSWRNDGYAGVGGRIFLGSLYGILGVLFVVMMTVVGWGLWKVATL